MAATRFFGLLSFLSFVFVAFATSNTAISACDTTGEDIVKFTIDLTWDDVNPTGGVARKAILTNGTIPGPALSMKVGQTVEFLVINNLPNVTSIHFHGISQKATPWSDGVPGLTQFPIPAGETYTYKWTADEPGTYFYHSHYKGQLMDGLYGAIIISQDDAEKPFGLISNDSTAIALMEAAEAKNEPIFISDWTQYTFNEFHQIEVDANVDSACADSIILNGKGSVYCLSRDEITAYTSPALPALLAAVSPSQLTDKGCLPPNLPATQGNFTRNLAALPAPAYYQCTPSTGENYTVTVDPADGWAALTFINSGGFTTLKFTIDSHQLYVYAVDGHYVTPQVVDQVVVSNGDRYSVLVKLDQEVGTYPIRVANNGLNQVISGFGALAYKGSVGISSTADAVMNFAGGNLTTISTFVNKLASPYPAIAPAATADATYIFDIKKLGQPHGAYEWTLSGVNAYNMSEDDSTPLLYQDPNSIVASDLVIKTKANQWVDLIIKIEGPLAEPHPMHKHANKAFVLGQAAGTFNYSSVAEAAAALPAGTFNFVNPPYRDGYTTTPAQGSSSWLAIRYYTDVPGAWLFHCHMQTHLSGGMAIALLDGVDQFPTIPADVGTCDGGNTTASLTTGNGASTTGTILQFTGAASSVKASSVFLSVVAVVAVALSL